MAGRFTFTRFHNFKVRTTDGTKTIDTAYGIDTLYRRLDYLSLVAHRSHTHPTRWTVSEFHTGRKITEETHPTREDATNAAVTALYALPKRQMFLLRKGYANINTMRTIRYASERTNPMQTIPVPASEERLTLEEYHNIAQTCETLKWERQTLISRLMYMDNHDANVTFQNESETITTNQPAPDYHKAVTETATSFIITRK